MGRAPCCEKMGLKKGPWTPEEDQILINYINLYGHGNWRALPKQAGLLRCGKSCRLRWTNYLRPDIKRGNFTVEEEETIIKLHEMLGNRWSAIAARLPGRTDNEIKNVWHTHLKKRLKQNQSPHEIPEIKRNSIGKSKNHQEDIIVRKEQEHVNNNTTNISAHVRSESSENNNTTECYRPGVSSPPPLQECSSSDMSSSAITGDCNSNNIIVDDNENNNGVDRCIKFELLEENLPEVDEDFWSEVLSADNSHTTTASDDFQAAVNVDPLQFQLSFSPLSTATDHQQVPPGYSSNLYDNMDFWYNLFTGAPELTHLPGL